jgi:hypothetical protein
MRTWLAGTVGREGVIVSENLDLLGMAGGAVEAVPGIRRDLVASFGTNAVRGAVLLKVERTCGLDVARPRRALVPPRELLLRFSISRSNFLKRGTTMSIKKSKCLCRLRILGFEWTVNQY